MGLLYISFEVGYHISEFSLHLWVQVMTALVSESVEIPQRDQDCYILHIAEPNYIIPRVFCSKNIGYESWHSLESSDPNKPPYLQLRN